MKNNVINANEMENVNGGFYIISQRAKEIVRRQSSETSADKQDD